MKDLINREIKEGQYITYALTEGRSANLAIYKVSKVFEEKIKAIKIEASYGHNNYGTYTLPCGKEVPFKYIKWDSKYRTHVEMTDEDKIKVDNKTSTLSMPERVFILNDFKPEIFKE